MESSICARQILSSAPLHHHSLSLSLSLSLSFPRRRRRHHPPSPHKNPTRSAARLGRFRLPIYSKRSDFRDYQDYAKPSRLLPATDLNICTETSQEKIVTSLSLGRSQSLFKVKLQTSGLYDSSLSNLNSAISLLLIDENGDSILLRLPADPMKDCSTESKSMVDRGEFCFQRGSVDEFTFKGPKLGRIVALWISLESGQWRLGGADLTVISVCQPPLEKEVEETEYVASQYNFEGEDILLGGDMSLVELRPCLATESSEADPSTLLTKTSPMSPSLSDIKTSNEESMKEYADLKFSLLFYDAILISVGTTFASFSAGENVGFAFLTGGVGGFLYLWLLQRSVDGLPAPELRSAEARGIFKELFSGIKSPISSLALAIGVAALAAKFGLGDGDISPVVTPKEIVVGMMGFLACKVAVVLAALKPLPIGAKANK